MARPNLLKELRIQPRTTGSPEGTDPSATYGREKAAALAATQKQLARMAEVQDRRWAEQKRPVLVVLQGIDAARRATARSRRSWRRSTRQGCVVSAFKVPTPEELAHDYLWRVHQRVPAKGVIGIFNRSHYEEVLVVRVHGLVPRAVWSKRYEQINEFEQMLTANGTTIVKCFLSIDRDEAARGSRRATRTRTKRWKFAAGRPRRTRALGRLPGRFDDMLSRTFHRLGAVVRHPGQPQWFRNLAVSTILADTPRRACGRPIHRSRTAQGPRASNSPGWADDGASRPPIALLPPRTRSRTRPG